MDLSQWMILICSCISIWGMAGKEYKVIGFTAGLVGQPFWIYATWTSGQWGMFAVSLWFTFNHVRGLRNHWPLARYEIDAFLCPKCEKKAQYDYSTGQLYCPHCGYES